ncbi:MAG TPA: serine/threonine-protein kinase [Candidatus Obscuribacterales bacterium]
MNQTCPRDGTFLVNAPEGHGQLPALGTTIASYKLVAGPVLGSKTAMYKAAHTSMPRTVVFRMLLPKFTPAADIVARFHSEAKLTTLINHAYVVSIFDVGVTPDGNPYCIEDYFDGLPFDQYLKRPSTDINSMIEMFSKIAEALNQMHQKGIVHLALKPSHIIVVPGTDGKKEPRLIDFYQAEIINQARSPVQDLPSVFRDYGFPSPEFLSGKSLDGRSDIYSLGCLMYKSLTGQAPFTGRDAEELKRKHLEERPRRLNDCSPDRQFPSILNNCIMTALEKDPANRFTTAEELKRELMMITPTILRQD